MTIVDWVIVAVLAISILVSLKRGFVREALSLVSWVLSFVVAKLFGAQLATLLQGRVETESLRWIIAFASLFLGTQIIGALLINLVSAVINATGLTGTDRVFGMAFGLVRGLVVLVAVVYGLQYTVMPNDTWWKESILIPYLSTFADWAEQALPGAAAQLTSTITQ